MHPATTYELTRAILADREREARDHALAKLARARTAGDRPRHARRASAARLVMTLRARLRAPDPAAHPTTKAGATDLA